MHTTVLFDESNEFSVINCIAGSLKTSIERVDKHYFEMNERELRQHINPTPVDQALRISFWREYTRYVNNDKRVKSQRKVNGPDIFVGICSDIYFYQTVLRSDRRMAWIITPMPRFMARGEALLVQFWERLDEILEIPFQHEGKNGRQIIDNKNIKTFMETLKYVEDRLHGSAVKKSINVNYESSDVIPVTAEKTLSLAEMDDEISKHEGEIYGSASGQEEVGGSEDIQNEEENGIGEDQQESVVRSGVDHGEKGHGTDIQKQSRNDGVFEKCSYSNTAGE